ncbi:MAG: hypothetical protein ACYDHH_17150 [Solirubrobacteraceae bacterium]
MIVVAALIAAGCGAARLTNAALRSRATRICTRADARAVLIAPPTAPAATASFLENGIAVLAAEQTTLRRLEPSGAAGKLYQQGLGAINDELKALRATVEDLRRGTDPVLLIGELQGRLIVLEQRADAAWTQLQIPACLTQ